MPLEWVDGMQNQRQAKPGVLPVEKHKLSHAPFHGLLPS